MRVVKAAAVQLSPCSIAAIELSTRSFKESMNLANWPCYSLRPPKPWRRATRVCRSSNPHTTSWLGAST